MTILAMVWLVSLILFINGCISIVLYNKIVNDSDESIRNLKRKIDDCRYTYTHMQKDIDTKIIREIAKYKTQKRKYKPRKTEDYPTTPLPCNKNK